MIVGSEEGRRRGQPKPGLLQHLAERAFLRRLARFRAAGWDLRSRSGVIAVVENQELAPTLDVHRDPEPDAHPRYRKPPSVPRQVTVCYLGSFGGSDRGNDWPSRSTGSKRSPRSSSRRRTAAIVNRLGSSFGVSSSHSSGVDTGAPGFGRTE